jgi:hypothetical protein
MLMAVDSEIEICDNHVRAFPIRTCINPSRNQVSGLPLRPVKFGFIKEEAQHHQEGFGLPKL